MTPEETAFEAQILENTKDMLTRHIYADWLDDHDDLDPNNKDYAIALRTAPDWFIGKEGGLKFSLPKTLREQCLKWKKLRDSYPSIELHELRTMLQCTNILSVVDQDANSELPTGEEIVKQILDLGGMWVINNGEMPNKVLIPENWHSLMYTDYDHKKENGDRVIDNSRTILQRIQQISWVQMIEVHTSEFLQVGKE